METIKPHGLIIPKPDRRDYVLGGKKELKGVVLRPDGQWDDFLPPGEIQNLAVEPEACTSFGTLNVVEMLERQEFGTASEWSDRFLAYISGTTENGNDPNKVAQTLKNMGVVPETDWPYTKDDNTWNTFYEKPPQNLITKALEFIAEYDFGHQWIPTDPQSLMKALQYSPLGAGGFAWAQDADGYYYTPNGAQPRHWFAIYGYVEGKYWKVFDSYAPYVKTLRWDYDFALAKSYTLHRQVVDNTAWGKFLAFMKQILGI